MPRPTYTNGGWSQYLTDHGLQQELEARERAEDEEEDEEEDDETTILTGLSPRRKTNGD
jgi:hypothetical protein